MAKKAETEQTTAAGGSPVANEKKSKITIKYPPYVNAYGAIPKLFEEITKASVPPKCTQDFMETVLGLKSSSHRALIPLLKKLGFLDAANVPTEAYKNYRDATKAKAIMAAQMRMAYTDIYKANEYAHNLSKDELTTKLRTLTGAAEDDPNINSVVGTFLELKKLADFQATSKTVSSAPVITSESATGHDEDKRGSGKGIKSTLGLSYTINLNLPATTEIEVFNAIFKSLKEHLLDGQ